MNDTQTKRTSNKASLMQQAAIFKLLDQHVVHVGDGQCQYQEGWSDELIAKEVEKLLPDHGPVSLDAVKYRRNEIHGKLVEVDAHSLLLQRIKLIEKRVGVLAIKLGIKFDENGFHDIDSAHPNDGVPY